MKVAVPQIKFSFICVVGHEASKFREHEKACGLWNIRNLHLFQLRDTLVVCLSQAFLFLCNVVVRPRKVGQEMYDAKSTAIADGHDCDQLSSALGK